jgi:rhamnopyranosyl-N-acetylglucosaminyl-diphospho-decaprenol beta-1,3/1,4-galactofuranosyltransferase
LEKISLSKIITAIIVTHNRKKLLLRCLSALWKQTRLPDNLLIIDNASSDGTFSYIYQNLYAASNDAIPPPPDNTLTQLPGINAINLYCEIESTNIGGAGGFSRGMKIAHDELQSEYFWLMDDDGFPDEECLERLLPIVDEYDYVMPVSIDIENHTRLSWATRLKNGRKTKNYETLKNSWGSVMDYVVPFNGALLTQNCVDLVGYIKADMFIWGDDYEHYWRCRKNSIRPKTILDAVFYHPAQKLELIPILGSLVKVPYTDSKLKMICLIRNHTYIYLHYRQQYKIILKFFLYTWFFLVSRRGDIQGYKLYILSVLDGMKGNFTRHLRYLN